MKHLINLMLACGWLIAGTGCSSWIVVDPPADQLNTNAVFKDDASAIAALRGLYSQTMVTATGMFNCGNTLAGALSADELMTVSANTIYDPLMNNEILPANSATSHQTWSQAYKGIYMANDLLKNVASNSNLRQATINQITGEALFIRSLYLFYLTNFFDSIPLPLTTDFQQNALLSRSSQETVYDRIAEDLKTADELLPPAYPSSGKVRVNKWAVAALRARLHLYRREWPQAIAQATDVITKGGYQLDSLDQVFLTGSREAILQFASIDIYNTNTGAGVTFVPLATSVPAYKVNPLLLNSFEPGDFRLENWFSTITRNNQQYTIPFKYRQRPTGPDRSETNVVLRLSEMYLIRAEALAMDDKPGLAVEDLNILRRRARLLPLRAEDLTPAQLEAAIFRERQAELNIEWGHRWLDLKRSGRINEVMHAAKPGKWKPESALFPIPQNDRLNNPNLTQNPGYSD